ncbi:MAG: hypothetical protein Q9207_003288 [Kuettlingeria erythrocarpa]
MGTPEFQHWFMHNDTYGPISSITVMGLPLVIFHDKDAAHAVMGKIAQKSSAWPQLNFATLCGFDNFLITHQYDDKYRKHRKMVPQEIGTEGFSAAFEPIQEREHLAAANILKIIYGYEIEGMGPHHSLIEHALNNLSPAFVPLS